LQGQLIAQHCQLWIVTLTFVAHESVVGIEFMPGKNQIVFGQFAIDLDAAFSRNVRILPTPYHKQFACDLFASLHAVLAGFIGDDLLVQIGGIKTRGRFNFRLQCRTESQMAADAESNRPDDAGTPGLLLYILDQFDIIAIVALYILGFLVGIALVASGIVIA
jgi:hypothetical protein